MTDLARARRPFFAACPVCGATAHRPLIEFPELAFVTCVDCGLVYKREEVAGLAPGYDETYFRQGQAKYLTRWNHRVNKCARQLLMCLEFAPQARRVLDVGCSAGYVLAAGTRLGLEPVGIDIARFTAGLAHERGFNSATASLTALPFADASFDVITLKHTLEHVNEPLTALRDIARVLRPGGVAFIIVPDSEYWRVTLRPRSGKYFRPERLGWQHHVYYSVASLSRAVQAVGLDVVSTDKAMLRRRLAKGSRAPWEWVRYAGLAAWTTFSRVTHLRREIQVIARKPSPSPARGVHHSTS